jgi:hypothetical protein
MKVRGTSHYRKPKPCATSFCCTRRIDTMEALKYALFMPAWNSNAMVFNCKDDARTCSAALHKYLVCL